MHTRLMNVRVACPEEEDVSSGGFDRAFLHAPTDEPIYVEPPAEAKLPRDVVWRCKKGLYGSRKAPYWFQEWLAKLMVEKPLFLRLVVDPQIFRGPGPRENRLKVSIHVDDPWIVGKRELIEKFFKDFGERAHFRRGHILEVNGEELKCIDLLTSRLIALIHVSVTGKWSVAEHLQTERSRDEGLANPEDLWAARKQARIYSWADESSSSSSAGPGAGVAAKPKTSNWLS